MFQTIGSMQRRANMGRGIVCLLLALIGPRAMASFEEAMTLYEAKDYPSAFAEFRRLAEIGDHAAQFNVGAMYYLGQSIDPDPAQGYAWMALANQVEDPAWKKKRDAVYAALTDAQKALADTARENLFARLSDEALARQLAPELSSVATDFGSARVKKRVAPSYPRGEELDGKSGYAEIIFAVGVDGTTRLHGVVRATDTAFARAGVDAVKRWRFEPAQVNGKPVEEYGKGIRFVFKMEGAEAKRGAVVRLIDDLHEKAEKGGAPEAYKYASTLEVLSAFTEIPASAGNPNQWYWKAASRGNAAAQFSLGNNLLYGNACTPDSSKGLKWLQRAAEAGQPEAQYVLALEMLSGGRLAQQRDAALKWLARAATSDFAAAKLKLAWLYATSPDDHFRNPALALSYLTQISPKFIDRLSLFEVQAAVAAASGKFPDAARLQQDAIEEAQRYDLPTEALLPKLRAYQEGKVWIEGA